MPSYHHHYLFFLARSPGADDVDTIAHDFGQEQKQNLNDHTYKIDDHSRKIAENDQKGYDSFEPTEELDDFGPVRLS